MNKEALLKKYKSSFLDIPFINENVCFAFGEEQLQETLKKLGANNINEVVSIFGLRDFCLKTNAEKILKLVEKFNKEKDQWLKSLSDEEKEIIIRYEIKNYECTYTYNIQPVIDKLKPNFSKKIITEVWNKVK